MNVFKKIWGKIIYGFGKFLEVTFGLFIYIVELITRLVRKIGKAVFSIVSMGGIFLFLLIGPRILFNPLATLVVVFLVIFPILGSKFISFLKYVNYTMTEYLFDYADYLIIGRKAQFSTFGEYGRKYRKMEEERNRKEQEKRRESQQTEWEERFRQWTEYQNTQSSNSYGNYNWGGQNYRQGNRTYINPNIEFKNKYEKSCDLLGVDYQADKYEIKLAYRKKAKKFHPDINKAPDATQRFQEISDAYDFLSDANIERYKKAS